MEFEGEKYRYVYNLQGDVVGIVDATGTLVVEYQYDAWGKLGSITGSLADTLGKDNPFYYRGYIYDKEIRLYYLRNRYFYPASGRFINADILIINDLRLCNSFAYCAGNPTILSDTDGLWPSLSGIFKTVASTALAVAGAALAVAAVPAIIAAGVGAVTVSALAVAGVALGVASVAVVGGLVHEANKRKPSNLPSYKKVSLNMDHIMSGHGSGGKRGGPNKDKFPDWVTTSMAERIIRTAYKNAERIRTQGDRVFVKGPWGKRVIEMWVNTIKKCIESAWPKY